MSCTPAFGNNNNKNRGNISSNFLNSLPFGSFAESWVAMLVQLCKWIVYWQECHLQPVLHKHCTIILTNCTPNWQRGKLWIGNWSSSSRSGCNWQLAIYPLYSCRLQIVRYTTFYFMVFWWALWPAKFVSYFFSWLVFFSYLNYGTYRCLWRSELTVLSVALAAKYYNLYA